MAILDKFHPTLIDKLKLNQDAFLFNLNLTELISAVKETVPRFKHLPQFPEVRRDIAFIINDDVTFEDIQKVIKSSVKQNIFKGSEIFDVYQGEHVEDGFKSVAFRIKMQDENATLTDEIIEEMKKLNSVSVQVSLYSMVPQVHDQITKLPGSWMKTVNSILKLYNADIQVQVSCPSMKLNMGHYNHLKL